MVDHFFEVQRKLSEMRWQSYTLEFVHTLTYRYYRLARGIRKRGDVGRVQVTAHVRQRFQRLKDRGDHGRDRVKELVRINFFHVLNYGVLEYSDATFVAIGSTSCN